MPVVIKRYQNRKLYNTQSKCHITLAGIEGLIKEGKEIKVIDNLSGDDITAVTLSQVIFEQEKNHSGFLPINLLISLVQSGGNRIEDIRHNIFNSLSLSHHYDVEIERRVNLLIESGEVTEQEGNQLLRKLLAPGHQSLSVGEEGGERILEFLRERQISTKRDFQTLIQRVEGLSKRVDSLNLNRLPIEENNKED